MNFPSRLFVAAIAAFVTILLASCGGSGGNSQTSPTTTTPVQMAPTAPAQPAPTPAITPQMTAVQLSDGTHYTDNKVQLEPTSAIAGYLKKRESTPIIGLVDLKKTDFTVFPVVTVHDAYIVPGVDSVNHKISLSLVNGDGTTLSGSTSSEVVATLVGSQPSIIVTGSLQPIQTRLDVDSISAVLTTSLPTYPAMSPEGRSEEIDAMARCLVAYLS